MTDSEASDTYGAHIRKAAARLREAGVASPDWDARAMAAHLIHVGHLDIPLNEQVIPGFSVAFEALVSRREQREPLQHILGLAWFGPLELKVGPGVFIPRPETEVLADWASNKLRGLGKSSRAVDLCTGSGALAAYIAHEAPLCQVRAVELSDAALPYAQANLKAQGVGLIHGDVTDPQIYGENGPLADWVGSVDVVVSNPPYVPETDELDAEVYADPHMAVFGGDDGMSVINQMVHTIAALCAPGAWVGIEHDDSTSLLVQETLRSSGYFEAIDVLRDLNGIDRFVLARRAHGAAFDKRPSSKLGVD